MKITVVLERPTQFDTPLFRLAANDSRHDLRVLYTSPTHTPAIDPELGRAADWGEDLLAGYDCAIAPIDDAPGWLARELVSRRDLVILNGYTQRRYLAANRAAHRTGSPTALRLDSVPFDEGPPLRRLPKRLIFRVGVSRLFQLFLGVGSLTLRYLAELGVPESRRGLFPYPVDEAGLRRRAAAGPSRIAVRAHLGIPEGATVVLAIAKLHPRETPWDLLRAWAASEHNHDRWLLLVGDGPDRQVVERFRDQKGLARLIMPGYIPYAELPAMYRASDVFVHAPREERWGVSVAEALACRLPVVASTRVGAATDLIAEGESGIIYEAGDWEMLGNAIDRALVLDGEHAARASDGRLARFGIQSTWEHLIAAAHRAREVDL